MLLASLCRGTERLSKIPKVTQLWEVGLEQEPHSQTRRREIRGVVTHFPSGSHPALLYAPQHPGPHRQPKERQEE